jgi:hypothetical protein
MDLRFHWPSQNPRLSADVLEAGITQIDRASGPAEGRIYIAPWAEQQLLYSNVPDRSQDLLGKRLAMWSNLNLLETMPKLGGAMTLRLRHQEEVQKRIEQLSDSNSLPVLDYLSVAYTTSSTNAVQWQLRHSALPWITGGQVPSYFEQDSDSLEALVSPEFDPTGRIILPAEAGTRGEPLRAVPPQVEVRRISSQHVRLILEIDEPAWVSMAQSYHHAWRATLEGQRIPVWRANHAFQAIGLPPGSHQVDLRYVDRRFVAGAICSVIVIVLCGAGFVRRKERLLA